MREDGRFFYHDGRSSKGHREKPFELSESDVKRALDECFEEISARHEKKLVGYVEPTMEQIDNIPDSDENLDEVDQETGGPRRRRRRRKKNIDDDDDDESWKKVCSLIHI